MFTVEFSIANHIGPKIDSLNLKLSFWPRWGPKVSPMGSIPKWISKNPLVKNSPPFCWCLMVITFRIRCGIVQTNNNWIRFHSTKIDFDVARWKIIGRCSLPDGGWNRVNTIYLMASIGGSSLNWVAAGYEPPEDNDISFIQYNWNTLFLPIGEIVIMKRNNCNVNYALFLFTLS